MMEKCIAILSFLVFIVSGCSFTQKVKTGRQAYEVKQYAVASRLFEKEYAASQSLQEKAYLAFYAGESFARLQDPVSASKWFETAHKDGFGNASLDRYANMLKQQERYSEAIQVYENLVKGSPGNAFYRSQITLCQQAADWKRNPNAAYEIEPVSFNSSAAEYSPQMMGPGLILFTSDRNADSRQGEESYLWTGRAFSDLFIYNTISGQVLPFDSRINSKDNDGTAVISPDGNLLVFTRCVTDKSYDAWCKLMYCRKQGNSWSAPETFSFIQDKVNYGQPAFAAAGTTLFFSSDAPNGQGGHDLYFTQMDNRGVWSEPINLGPVINTQGEELYPTVYQDTLFFSSDHHPGLGGLDIFKTYLDQQGLWVPPVNLRAPVNSGADDFGFIVDLSKTATDKILLEGYFSSSRNGAAYSDDIFSFKQVRKGGEDIAVVKQDEVKVIENPVQYQVFISIRVMEPEFEVKGDPNSKRVGRRPLPNGPVIVSEGLTDQRFVTDDLGQLLLKLEWDKEYTFTARYRDHLTATYSLNTGSIERNEKNPITTINKLMELDPIFKDKEIVLENIFYDYDEWTIREDAKPSLNQLSVVLKNNPSIRIQLSSHTDCRGTVEYNQELSQKRAQSAVEYLMSVGIPPKRLVAQGFGESSPAVNCICEQCSELDHQKNRRTTFKIID